MKRARPLGEEERALWDSVKRSVAPLKRRRVAAPAAPLDPPPSEDAPRRKATKTAAPSVPVAPLPAPRPGPPPLAPLGRRMKQKLARGSEPIEARIDLHGMTQSEAHHALARFLRSAQRDGVRMALVITGKGLRPGADPFAERGVLKRQVPLWLESAELRPLVVGFEDASRGHGGQGALYVRLRRTRE